MKPLRLILLVPAVTLLIVYSCKRDNSLLLNLDFEKFDSNTKNPVNWSINKTMAYKVSLDSVEVYNGKYSMRMEKTGDNNFPSEEVDIYKLISNIQPANNIRLSAYIKTEKATVDSIGIFLGCNGFEGDTVIRLRDKRLIGTSEWNEYTIELPVLKDENYFYIGMSFNGEGKIWIDNLKFYVDGKQIHKMPHITGFKANKKELEWLKTHFIPIKTVQAGSGFEDLEPLRKLIGDARIVGLGENTHGTKEVFKMKHRLVEFLASEMGFTIFSIEANMPESYKLNDYVSGDTYLYDPKSLLKGMYFWTWNTQEVLDMIWWMKKFNSGGVGKIQFTGFDMQYYMGSMDNLSKFAGKYDPLLKVKTDALSGLFENLKLKGQKVIESRDEIAFVKKKCEELYSYLTKNELKILQKINAKEYKWLVQNAKILVQCIELAQKPNSGFTYRDESMANNIQWILENNPDSKIVIWAHNGHITKESGHMGSFLSKKYGDKYYNVGFLSNSGTYTAVKSGRLSSNNVLEEAKPGSFEYNFHKTNTPCFYFDFNRINDDEPESKWLSYKLDNRNLGAVASDNQFNQSKIIRQYNAIIFIDSTSASRCFDVIK